MLISIANLKVGSLLYRRHSNKWLFVAIIVKLNMFTGFQRYCSNHFMYIKILLRYIRLAYLFFNFLSVCLKQHALTTPGINSYSVLNYSLSTP